MEEESLSELRAVHEARLAELTRRLEAVLRSPGTGASEAASLRAQVQAERYNLDVLRYHHQRVVEGRPVLSEPSLSRLMAVPQQRPRISPTLFEDEEEEDEDEESADDEDDVAPSPTQKQQQQQQQSRAKEDAPRARAERRVLSRAVREDLQRQRDESAANSRGFRANPLPDFIARRARERKKEQQQQQQQQAPSPSSAAEKKASPQKQQKPKWQRTTKPSPPRPSVSTLDQEEPESRQFRANPLPAALYGSERPSPRSRYLQQTRQAAESELEPPPFRPHINTRVPDFSRIHAALQRRSELQREDFVPTVHHEFAFRSPEHRSDAARIMADIARDETTLPETRWPFKSPRAPVQRAAVCTAHGPPSKPIRTTLSTEMRAAVVRRTVEEEEKKRLEKEREKQRKQQHERFLAHRMAPHLDRSSEAAELERQQRVQANLEDLRRQELEYKESLDQKLSELEESRVFLFERFRADSAATRAQDRFARAVGGTGLSPEQFRARARANLRAFLAETRPVEETTHRIPSAAVPAQTAEHASSSEEEVDEEEVDDFAEDFEDEDEDDAAQ